MKIQQLPIIHGKKSRPATIFAVKPIKLFNNNNITSNININNNTDKYSKDLNLNIEKETHLISISSQGDLKLTDLTSLKTVSLKIDSKALISLDYCDETKCIVIGGYKSLYLVKICILEEEIFENLDSKLLVDISRNSSNSIGSNSINGTISNSNSIDGNISNINNINNNSNSNLNSNLNIYNTNKNSNSNNISNSNINNNVNISNNNLNSNLNSNVNISNKNINNNLNSNNTNNTNNTNNNNITIANNIKFIVELELIKKINLHKSDIFSVIIHKNLIFSFGLDGYFNILFRKDFILFKKIDTNNLDNINISSNINNININNSNINNNTRTKNIKDLGIHGALISSKNNLLFIRKKKTLIIYNLSTIQPLKIINFEINVTEFFFSKMSMSPCEKFLAVSLCESNSNGDYCVEVIDVDNIVGSANNKGEGIGICRFAGFIAAVEVLSFCPKIFTTKYSNTINTNPSNSNFILIAIASQDKTLTIFTSISSSPLLILENFAEMPILDLQWNKNGNILFVSCFGGIVKRIVFEEFNSLSLDSNLEVNNNFDNTNSNTKNIEFSLFNKEIRNTNSFKDLFYKFKVNDNHNASSYIINSTSNTNSNLDSNIINSNKGNIINSNINLNTNINQKLNLNSNSNIINSNTNQKLNTNCNIINTNLKLNKDTGTGNIINSNIKLKNTNKNNIIDLNKKNNLNLHDNINSNNVQQAPITETEVSFDFNTSSQNYNYNINSNVNKRKSFVCLFKQNSKPASLNNLNLKELIQKKFENYILEFEGNYLKIYSNLDIDANIIKDINTNSNNTNSNNTNKKEIFSIDLTSVFPNINSDLKICVKFLSFDSKHLTFSFNNSIFIYNIHNSLKVYPTLKFNSINYLQTLNNKLLVVENNNFKIICLKRFKVLDSDYLINITNSNSKDLKEYIETIKLDTKQYLILKMVNDDGLVKEYCYNRKIKCWIENFIEIQKVEESSEFNNFLDEIRDSKSNTANINSNIINNKSVFNPILKLSTLKNLEIYSNLLNLHSLNNNSELITNNLLKLADYVIKLELNIKELEKCKIIIEKYLSYIVNKDVIYFVLRKLNECYLFHEFVNEIVEDWK